MIPEVDRPRPAAARTLLSALSITALLACSSREHALTGRVIRYHAPQTTSFVAERSGLRLDVTVRDYGYRSDLVVVLTNLSGPVVDVFATAEPPDPIWDAHGFVFEKRSSWERWVRAQVRRDCGNRMPDGAHEFWRGSSWTTVLPLGLMQAWERQRPPPVDEPARLDESNYAELQALTRVRVKVLAPASYSVGWMGFPRLSDDEIPWVEVVVTLPRPLFVLPPRADWPPLPSEIMVSECPPGVY